MSPNTNPRRAITHMFKSKLSNTLLFGNDKIWYGKNTMITLDGKYSEYEGSDDVDKKRLAIGGFESALLADLVAAFILENTEDLFKNSIYSKIYRDDGVKVGMVIQTTDEI